MSKTMPSATNQNNKCMMERMTPRIRSPAISRDKIVFFRSKAKLYQSAINKNRIKGKYKPGIRTSRNKTGSTRMMMPATTLQIARSPRILSSSFIAFSIPPRVE